MKKLLAIIVLGLLWGGNANAGFFDPTVAGCAIENETGKKLHCVSIKYNESKNPGSLRRAENECYRTLNHYGRKYARYGHWIGGSGCNSSAGPFN
jgi:hypothetical protein